MAAIRSYSITNANSWYTFINLSLGREAPNGSLYIVTGCDKSTAWGIATVGEASSSQSFPLQFTAIKATIGASYSCSWSSTCGAVTRSSAPSDLGPNVVQPQNQCLFVRGYKIMVREGIAAKLKPTGRAESIVGHSKASSLLRWQQNSPFPGVTNGRSSLFTPGASKEETDAEDSGWSAKMELEPPVAVRAHSSDTTSHFSSVSNRLTILSTALIDISWKLFVMASFFPSYDMSKLQL